MAIQRCVWVGCGLLIVCVLAGLLRAAPASAQAQSLVWERLDVDVAVQPDGSALVTETSTVNFTAGQFGRGFRIFDPDPDIKITDARAEDDAGAALRVERVDSESEGLRLTYYFAAPVEQQRRTFKLTYRVRGIVQVATRDNIALNWSAVFAERSGVPIEASRVIVRLPGDAIIREATAYGVEVRRSGIDEATVTFESAEPIPSGVSLTVDLIFASDVLLPQLVPTAAPAATVALLDAEPSPDAEQMPAAGEVESVVVVAPTRTPGLPSVVERYREERIQRETRSDLPALAIVAIFLLLVVIFGNTLLRKLGLVYDSSAEVYDEYDEGNGDTDSYTRRRAHWQSDSSSSSSWSSWSSSSSSSSESSSRRGSSSDSKPSGGKGSGGGGFG